MRRAALPIALLAALLVAGCRAEPPAGVDAADPLAGIEAAVDAVERDLDGAGDG